MKYEKVNMKLGKDQTRDGSLSGDHARSSLILVAFISVAGSTRGRLCCLAVVHNKNPGRKLLHIIQNLINLFHYGSRIDYLPALRAFLAGYVLNNNIAIVKQSKIGARIVLHRIRFAELAFHAKSTFSFITVS